jgi:aerotolerance regulator-like protein
MTFAAPLFAWIAGGAALVTVALHLLAWRRPPETPLPTARFAPEEPVRTLSRAVRPADLALLALRVLLLLLAGFALASPSFVPKRSGSARVIVVDRSLDSSVSRRVADSARRIFGAGDALVVFDSVAREVRRPTRDSIVGGRASLRPGMLSAGIVAAVRVAKRLEREHDSVEIVVASAFAGGELDAATAGVRRLWSGAVRRIRVPVAPNDSSQPSVPTVRAVAGDPVAASLALNGPIAGGIDVRVVRDAVTADDSAWARAGHTVVAWPHAVAGSVGGRATADTAFAVTATDEDAPSASGGAATVVAPFVRTEGPPLGGAAARWSDGELAATESALGAGCVRSVAVAVPDAGDLALTPAFRRFAALMAQRCQSARQRSTVSDSMIAAVLPASLPPGSVVNPAAAVGSEQVSPLTPWLLGAALVAAVAELLVRRGRANAPA